MSRIPCNVNKDLLPLYVDDVCSEESKELVEEHLSECEACQGYYDAMKEGISKEEFEGDKESLISKEQERKAQASVIKGVKKQIANRHVRTVSLVLALCLLFVIVFEGLDGAFVWSALGKFPPFDTRPKLEEMEITELYQLENGYLYVTVEMEEGHYVVWPSNLEEAFEKDKSTGSYEPTGSYEGGVVFVKSLTGNYMETPRMSRCTLIYPLSGQSVDEDEGKVETVEDSVIYLEGKGGKRTTVWEKGQSVEKAPTAVEKIAQKEITAADTAADAGLDPVEDYQSYLLRSMNEGPYIIMWDAKD